MKHLSDQITYAACWLSDITNYPWLAWPSCRVQHPERVHRGLFLAHVCMNKGQTFVLVATWKRFHLLVTSYAEYTVCALILTRWLKCPRSARCAPFVRGRIECCVIVVSAPNFILWRRNMFKWRMTQLDRPGSAWIDTYPYPTPDGSMYELCPDLPSQQKTV